MKEKELKHSVDLSILEKRPDIAEIQLREYINRFNNDFFDNFAINRYNKIRELYQKKDEH
ncbi:hypothetical protein COU53_00640 [Candidatus Pacearchaeota archaeon CG10_big_fil_rev_8_21_14_0_10_30_48]|nr:MAG: hypothetical protein COU53_00640 [Candidatus Pacearchaeota archaeon CG10_big_fil_rev_8_21_14_0_10_30_48]